MIVVNLFGAIGYMLLLATWAFLAALVVSLSLQNGTANSFIEVNGGSTTPVVTQPSITIIVAGYAIGALMAVLTVIVLLTFPYFLAKWGGRLLRRGMGSFHIELTRRSLFLVKSVLATVPLVGMIVINGIIQPADPTFALIHLVSTGLTITSIGAFFVQLLFARKYNVSVDKAW